MSLLEITTHFWNIEVQIVPARSTTVVAALQRLHRGYVMRDSKAESGSGSEPIAVTLDGATWRDQVLPQLSVAHGVRVNDVACVRTDCVAVGEQSTGSTTSIPYAEMTAGGVWTDTRWRCPPGTRVAPWASRPAPP
jgi:hypothetical protein